MLRTLICRVSFLIEQYIFPAVIMFFIIEKSVDVARYYNNFIVCLRSVLSGSGHAADIMIVSRFMPDALMIIYNAVALWALLIRKKLLQKSDTIPEVIVPLLSLSAFFSLNMLDRVPNSLNPLLIQLKWAFPLSLAGSLLIFSGLFISTIAIFQLRHSFAVTIQVRDIISRGIYRYVRHPIYFGYFIQIAGFLLAIPYLWTIFWALVSGVLFIKRAKLEENKIAAFFPEYRDYIKRTPFMIPRIK